MLVLTVVRLFHSITFPRMTSGLNGDVIGTTVTASTQGSFPETAIDWRKHNNFVLASRVVLGTHKFRNSKNREKYSYWESGSKWPMTMVMHHKGVIESGYACACKWMSLYTQSGRKSLQWNTLKACGCYCWFFARSLTYLRVNDAPLLKCTNNGRLWVPLFRRSL